MLRAIYTWAINNFTFLSVLNNRKIKSSIFAMGDENQYKWRLRLYHHGCEEGSNNYISLFLQLVEPENSEIPAMFDFSIIKSDGKRHLLASHKIRTYTQFKSLGYHELVSRHAVLDKKNGLLHDNNLKILCEVRTDATKLY